MKMSFDAAHRVLPTAEILGLSVCAILSDAGPFSHSVEGAAKGGMLADTQAFANVIDPTHLLAATAATAM